jgi:hypothetical protein
MKPMNSAIDLTPFGFTPTESLAFTSLLDLGPSSAYAVAKDLGVARANAYQALDGLRAKGACVLVEANPKIYRAGDPGGLLATISEGVTTKLDRLEAQIRKQPRPGAPLTTSFSSERAFREIVLRTAVRSVHLTGIGPPDVLLGLNPIWRKRAADGLESRLWAIGDGEVQVPVPLAGMIPVRHAIDLFGADPVVILVDDAVLVGRREEQGLAGYWTSDPVLMATTRGTAELLTQP